MAKKLITPSNEVCFSGSSKAPKISGVHPFGSKILVEILNQDELLDTNLFVPDNVKNDGAPQAYIIELGPQINSDSGLKVGQRIYWTGKGTAVEDPRNTKRVRALLEVHNIQAVIEEEGVCCGGNCE